MTKDVSMNKGIKILSILTILVIAGSNRNDIITKI